MDIKTPFNFYQWIEDNQDKLKPPVANKNLYTESGDYIVMVVGGPNARKDYHYNETEEFFFQIKGDIMVTIQKDGKAVKVPIKEGEMFLLPANIPHSPGRSENSVGLVIERKRKGTNYKDGLMWFCEQCNHKLYEEYFTLNDIENDFLAVFEKYYNSEELRTCDECGHVMESDPKFTK